MFEGFISLCEYPNDSNYNNVFISCLVIIHADDSVNWPDLRRYSAMDIPSMFSYTNPHLSPSKKLPLDYFTCPFLN